MVGLGLAIFQQLTGVNTIIYYTPIIMEKAGFKTASSAIPATVLIGSLIVVFNVIALFLLDRIGRRPLLLVSISAMGLALLHLGYSFGATDVSRIMVLLDFLAYLAAFCLGLGPVFWLLISEIYPTTIRAQAMSVASSVIWAGDLLVTITFLSLMEVLGARHAFWLYGALCGLALIFALRMVPETKDRTLEQIEASWSTVSRDR